MLTVDINRDTGIRQERGSRIPFWPLAFVEDSHDLDTPSVSIQQGFGYRLAGERVAWTRISCRALPISRVIASVAPPFGEKKTSTVPVEGIPSAMTVKVVSWKTMINKKSNRLISILPIYHLSFH